MRKYHHSKTKKCLDCGNPIWYDSTRCKPCSMKGKNNPFYGQDHTKKTKDKIRQSEYHQNLKGKNSPMYEKYLGEKSWLWKGGGKTHFSRIARKTMEQHLERKVKLREVIHHLDHNPKNNNIENLHLFPNHSEHTKYHCFLRNCVREELMNI